MAKPNGSPVWGILFLFIPPHPTGILLELAVQDGAAAKRLLSNPGEAGSPTISAAVQLRMALFWRTKMPSTWFPLLVKGQPHISAKPDCRLTAGSRDRRFGSQGEGSWTPLGTRPCGWWPSPPQTRGAAPRLNISVVSLGLHP